MIIDGRTLIVVADGGRARLFEEARRGGPLKERAEWIADLAPPHAAHPGPMGGSHSRMGYASHATARESGRDKAETGFLARLGRRLETVFAEQKFDHLVMIAAPRALGVLRRHLSPGLRARLALSQPHDRVAATAADIQETLRAMRRASA